MTFPKILPTFEEKVFLGLFFFWSIEDYKKYQIFSPSDLLSISFKLENFYRKSATLLGSPQKNQSF